MAGSRYAYVRNFELPDPLLPSTFFVIRIDGKGFHGFSKLHNFDKPNDKNALALMNEAAKRVVGGRELNGECVLAFGESDEYRYVPSFLSHTCTASIPLADGSGNSFVFKRTCKLHGRRSRFVSLSLNVFAAAICPDMLTFHNEYRTANSSLSSSRSSVPPTSHCGRNTFQTRPSLSKNCPCLTAGASQGMPHQDAKLSRSDTFPASRVVQYTSEEEVRDYLRWRQVDSESAGCLSYEHASDLG